jgi:hypothetical protein
VDNRLSAALYSNPQLFWGEFAGDFILISTQKEFTSQATNSLTNCNGAYPSTFFPNRDKASRGEGFPSSFVETAPGKVTA